MQLTNLGQWRSRKAKAASAFGVSATNRSRFGTGNEDMLDFLLESYHIWACFGIVETVRFFQVSVEFLQGVEDTLVVNGLGKDLGHDVLVVHAHVGDDDTGAISLGPQC